MTKPMIALKNVTKTFETANGEIKALDDVSIEIGEGEIFGVIGMSGAGKTTLVRCMNFLEQPTEGEVYIDGKALSKLSEGDLREVRQEAGMIFQHFNLLMQQNVSDNIKFALDIVGIKGKQASDRINELLELVDLPEKAKAYPSQLSGGQKQRVAIARALATNPKILLCDEATSALDPITTRAILSLLKEINIKMGITIIMITHEMSVIREICTKVAVMDGAKVVEEGRVQDVFTNPKTGAALRLFYSSEYAASGSGKRYRIVFDGTQVDRPILAGAINACGAPINIAYANMERIGENVVGHMVVDLPGDERAAQLALDFFENQELAVKEVR